MNAAFAAGTAVRACGRRWILPQAPRRAYCRRARGGAVQALSEPPQTSKQPTPLPRCSPYRLVRFARSRFVTYLDEMSARFGPEAVPAKDSTSEMMSALQEVGEAHEERVLERMRALGLDVVSFTGPRLPVLADTLGALSEQREVIHQARLENSEFSGIADFLLLAPDGVDWQRILSGDRDALQTLRRAPRDESTPYSVLEVKLSGSSKSAFLVQTLCYAYMLEVTAGRCSDAIFFWLGSTESPSAVNRRSYDSYFRGLMALFTDYRTNFDAARDAAEPDLAPDQLGPWTDAAKKHILEADGLQQVAGIRLADVAELRKLGVHTMASLAAADDAVLRRDVLRRLRRQAELQVRTKARRRFDPDAFAAYAVVQGQEAHLGLGSLPPPSDGDLFFDMEGYPLYAVEHGQGLEYMLGWVDDKRQFEVMWAHKPDDEAANVAAFVARVHARWVANPGMHVYHYGAYEVSALNRVAPRAGGPTEGLLSELLESGVFVDIYRVVRQGLVLGEDSYSIKKVEHLCDIGREGASLADAQSSVGLYYRSCCLPEGAERGELLGTIADYNRQDCESLADVTDWLRRLQAEEGIAFVPEPARPVEDEEEHSDEERELLRVSGSCGRTAELKLQDAQVIIEGCKLHEELIGSGRGDDRHNEVLAHLLGFHLREARPSLRRFRERIVNPDASEAYKDPECVASIRLVRQSEVEQRSRSAWEVHASFDELQPLALTAGARAAFVVVDDAGERRVIYGSVVAIRNDGTITLQLPEPWPVSPAKPLTGIGLAGLNFCPSPMRHALLRTAKTALEPDSPGGDGLATRFLRRDPPRLKDGRGIEALVDAARTSSTGLADLIDGLEASVLAIQGPPGSGKTRTCAAVIAELAMRGRRIAVTSSSHPSIENVLHRVAEAGVCTAKVPSLTGDSQLVLKSKSVAHAIEKKGASVVGATVYQLSRDENIGRFDFLFVDEAGQVPLANFVAIADCAAVAVLVGDQLQLEMPIQGSHDEASMTSSLQYAIHGDLVTVPKARGIFLDKSYRMSPPLCQLVSDLVYEGQLMSDSSAACNRVELPKASDCLLDRGSGVQYIGHIGSVVSSKSSSVEVEIVDALVEQLTELDFQTSTRAGTLTREDIMVVAPYNLQVASLRRQLGPNVRVGTVDKFQGQEAPVVIVSLCGVPLDEPADSRGLSFLLRKNRLNVALSRAQCLAMVVGPVELAQLPVADFAEMELVNLYCRIIESGSAGGTFQCFDPARGRVFRRDTLVGHLRTR